MCATSQTLSDSASISLITCSPGKSLYEHYGHTAIRVYDTINDIDLVFNYGTFNFNTDNFYWKFICGECYYQLSIEPTEDFISYYHAYKRTVYEQVLNMDHDQKQELWELLLANYLPKNRCYLYNFVFDNCATRPYQLIKQVYNDSIISKYEGYKGKSFRSFIQHYTVKHSWADFGINLLFGTKADQPMNNEQRLFLPEELMLYISQATTTDGTPIVKYEHIGQFNIHKPLWYEHCGFGIAVFALLCLLISLNDRKKKRISLWWDILCIIIYTLIFAIVLFLTFFSKHPLVGFSWRLLILPALHLCARLVYIIK